MENIFLSFPDPSDTEFILRRARHVSSFDRAGIDLARFQFRQSWYRLGSKSRANNHRKHDGGSIANGGGAPGDPARIGQRDDQRRDEGDSNERTAQHERRQGGAQVDPRPHGALKGRPVPGNNRPSHPTPRSSHRSHQRSKPAEAAATSAEATAPPAGAAPPRNS